MFVPEPHQDHLKTHSRDFAREKLHVLIIGAGSTGLLIGQGLQRAGIKYTIYEKTTHDTYRYRTRDWSMGVHWASELLQDDLPAPVIEKLESADTAKGLKITPYQQAYTPILNGKTGELFYTVDAISTKRFSRARLRDALAEGLDIRYGHEINSISVISDGVTASFTNGAHADGTLLIGCDSTNSFVRSWLVGKAAAETTDLPIVAYNFTQSFTAEQAAWLKDQAHPIMKCAPHPEQRTWHFICTLDARDLDPSKWLFQLFMHLWSDRLPSSTSEERLKHFKELAAGYAEPFRSAAQWVKPDTHVAYDRIKQWERPVPWDNHGGRVTLAGDAAHPMAPHRAQGLNHALQDAVLYTKAVEQVVAAGDLEARVKEVVDAYDKEVFARGSREIQVSAKQAYATMHWDVYLESPTVKHGHAVLEKDAPI